MTQQCNDPEKSTEFSNWLREQKALPSKGEAKCFVANNVDYMWQEYKESRRWIFLEEKRHGSWLKRSQPMAFARIHQAIADDKYMGFWVIVFENTSPDDGAITVHSTHIVKGALCSKRAFSLTKDKLLAFLRFEKYWHIPDEPPQQLTEKAERYESIIASRHG